MGEGGLHRSDTYLHCLTKIGINVKYSPYTPLKYCSVMKNSIQNKQLPKLQKKFENNCDFFMIIFVRSRTITIRYPIHLDSLGFLPFLLPYPCLVLPFPYHHPFPFLHPSCLVLPFPYLLPFPFLLPYLD